MKIKGVIKNLKMKNDNSKIYPGISLELLRAVWGQFGFRQFLVPPYTSQSLQVPSNVVSINYRVLICCTCHFQSGFLFFVYFGFLCKSLQCLISASHKGVNVVTYLVSHVQLCCGEGGTLQTNVTGLCGECSQCLGHTGFAPTHGVCAFMVYTAQALGCSAGNCLRRALVACTSQV